MEGLKNNLGYVDNMEGGQLILSEVAIYFGLYSAIFGLLVMIIALIVKLICYPNFDGTSTELEYAIVVTENSRLLYSREENISSSNVYGTTSEEDIESRKLGRSGSSSSDDLYDEKICAICYDNERSCLFVPCDHCITCFTCAKRIITEKNKTCPICRTFIQKVKKLQIL